MNDTKKLQGKQLGLRSVMYFSLIIVIYFLTCVVWAAWNAILLSIPIENAIHGVFSSVVDGFYLTLPFAGIGAIMCEIIVLLKMRKTTQKIPAQVIN